MSPTKSSTLATFAVISFAAGCATATSDGDSKPAAGDASVPGRSDAAHGIRPDAGEAAGPVDAGQSTADASQSAADANPQCVTAPVNLLRNADFDQGPPAVWVESSGGTPNPFPLIVSDSEIGGVTADSGSFLVWLGGYSSAAAVDSIYQDVLVPDDATPMTITGRMWIDSAEAPDLPWDTLTLAVVNVTSGAVLEQVASWSNMDAAFGWASFSKPLTGNYAGQTVRLRFRAELDSTNNSSFLLDTLSLNTTSCQ